MTGRTRPLARIPGLLELADRQLGLVSRRQLRELGVTRHHERTQIVAQRWALATTRVVAVLTGALGREQWMWVALLHGGGTSRLFGESALEAHGLTGWEPDLTHFQVPHGVNVPAAPGLVAHHARGSASERDVVRRGLRCEPAGRAVVSAASGMAQERRALGLVLASVQQRIVAPQDIAAHLRRGTRHAAAIRAVLGEAAAGADSLREVDVVRLIRRAGFRSYRRQVVVETMDGPRPYDVGVDLPDGTMLLIEVDGVHHLDPRVRQRDAAKDAAAAAFGHRVVRLPVQVIDTDGDRVVEQLARIRSEAERRTRSW